MARKTLEQAFARLAKFKTEKGLARFLEREGYRGKPRDGRKCPMARYFNEQTGNEVFVGMTVRPLKAHPSEGFKLTKAMDLFMMNFDAGNLPDLKSV
jgi:hypothetical protein